VLLVVGGPSGPPSPSLGGIITAAVMLGDQRSDTGLAFGLFRLAAPLASIRGFHGDFGIKRLAELFGPSGVTVGLHQETRVGSLAGLFGPGRPVDGFTPGDKGTALVGKGFRL